MIKNKIYIKQQKKMNKKIKIHSKKIRQKMNLKN